MTLKELFSEWTDLTQLLKGGLIGSVAILSIAVIGCFKNNTDSFISIAVLAAFLIIVMLCAIRVNKKK